MATESAKYLSTLHKQIDQYFSFAEVRTLCFDLGIDYDNIPGNAKSPFIRNLIVSLARQNRLSELIVLLRDQRPHVPWQDVPPNFSLPQSIAQEDIKQVVNHNYYGGVVHGNQVNVAGNAEIDHVGDKITMGDNAEYVAGNRIVQGDEVHGDKVGRDKIDGDQITVGNISDAEGIAIGDGAASKVTKTTTVQPSAEKQAGPATAVPPQIQPIIERINGYLQWVSTEYKTTATELAASVDIIMMLASAVPPDKLHLKLLLIGQEQLAADLEEDAPGIGKMVKRFGTAVMASVMG